MNTSLVHTKERDNCEETRPWGTMKQFILNERQSTINLLTVEPDKRLSLQSHEKRAELWVVLDEVALIQIDDLIREYRQGDIIHIPAGSCHRLSNPRNRSIRILEITFGEYDPDDIQRLEDDYGRTLNRKDQSTNACVKPK